ncbi:MAG: hypothetical protein K8T26_03080 [Lentisphaerae bacterium]|nr:hypothetical protein [Lentisphaerota bacterium]
MRRALAARRGDHPVPSVRFFPPVAQEAEFLDLWHKVAYYMPPGSAASITIPIAFTPSFALDRPLEFPVPHYLAPVPPVPRPDVHVVQDGDRSLAHALRAADLVYVLDWSAVPAGSMAAESARVRNVDRHGSSMEAWTWASFLHDQRPALQRDADLEASRQQLQARIAALPRYPVAYVFGTGPSLEQAWQRDFSDGYRIVCNMIVGNAALLDHLQPHFLVAGDAAYHFSLNQHAAAFQRDLDQALVTRDLQLITRDIYGPLLAAHHPHLRGRVLLAPSGKLPVQFDPRRLPIYYPMGNILTSLMLPLASALADRVCLLGFDGRAPQDTGFWKYAPAAAHADLLPAIAAAHPHFIPKTNAVFVDYANQHGDNTESLMQAGEAAGKRYVCLNESYIPACRKRWAGAVEAATPPAPTRLP